MPILPPTVSQPFDIVEDVLELVRVRMNDAIQTIAGEVYTDTAPFTQTMTNAGWRNMQVYLGNLGDTTFIENVILTNCPVVASIDPASEVQIDWSQYFDGENYWNTPVLPQDMLSPLRLWERTTGLNQSFDCSEMSYQLDGLYTTPKTIRNMQWEWRANKLCMPGSQQIEDLKLRYIRNVGDFLTLTAGEETVFWYEQQVPVFNCKSCLANYICAEGASARGDIDANAFTAKAEKDADIIFNRQVRLRQRTNPRRQSRSGRGSQNGIGLGYGY